MNGEAEESRMALLGSFRSSSHRSLPKLIAKRPSETPSAFCPSETISLIVAPLRGCPRPVLQDKNPAGFSVPPGRQHFHYRR